jgi:hypothetical protein
MSVPTCVSFAGEHSTEEKEVSSVLVTTAGAEKLQSTFFIYLFIANLQSTP